MPSVKDFEKKHAHKKTHTAAHKKHSHGHEKDSETIESAIDLEHNEDAVKAKRRPGRDHEVHADSAEASPDVAVVDVHEKGTDEATASVAEEQGSHGNSARAEEDSWAQAAPESKVELHFYGSEILRAKFPKAFDVAESVATDWIHDGNFEGLPLGHPLAQYFAAKGLKKAKEVEKKVMESPVTEKVAMQALQAGMKAQEFITQIREKVQKK